MLGSCCFVPSSLGQYFSIFPFVSLLGCHVAYPECRCSVLYQRTNRNTHSLASSIRVNPFSGYSGRYLHVRNTDSLKALSLLTLGRLCERLRPKTPTVRSNVTLFADSRCRREVRATFLCIFPTRPLSAPRLPHTHCFPCHVLPNPRSFGCRGRVTGTSRRTNLARDPEAT